jgi:hypothetical protein
MAGIKLFLALALASLLIAGCAQQPAPGQNNTNQSNVSVQQWAHYSNIGISFDYPAGMSLNQSLDSYPASALIVVQSSDAAQGAIIINYLNASLLSNLTRDPHDIAVGILDFDNSSGSDAMLGQADATGPISNYTTSGGLAAAEMRFTLPAGNVTLYGYALEFYDKPRAVSYPVRIISSSPQQTQLIRDRFVSSFRSG